MKQGIYRRPLALLAAASMILGIVFALLVPMAKAYSTEVGQDSDFHALFHKQTKGAIVITGNSLITCDRKIEDCAKYLDGKNSGYSNSQATMHWVDQDGDPSTVNSASAAINLPDPSKVLFAGLFWGGSGVIYNNQIDQEKAKFIKFKTPGGSYQTLQAQKMNVLGGSTKDYTSYTEVTELVKKAGNGQYWGANVESAANGQRHSLTHASWALVIAYQDDSLPPRDLTVFRGFKEVGSSVQPEVEVSGFTTPPASAGKVHSSIGTVAYEGDSAYGGDKLLFNGNAIGSGTAVGNNFFNGTINPPNGVIGPQNPGYKKTFAFDAKTVEDEGTVPNGASSARVKFSSNGDHYYPVVLTTQIDIYVPDVKLDKTVRNVSGNDPSQVGDILEYTIHAKNLGRDAADEFVLTDPLPQYVEYVPGSMKSKVDSQPFTKLTDKAGDDIGEYDPQKRQVIVHMGKNASSEQGGTLLPATSYKPGEEEPTHNPASNQTLVFRVRLAEGSAGKKIINTATADYRGNTSGKTDSTPSEAVAVPVDKTADLQVEKTGPSKAVSGSQVQWTVKVTNHGPGEAKAVSVHDQLPAELAFVSATAPGMECSHEGQNSGGGTVTCTVASLPNNESKQITVTTKLKADAQVDQLENTATVTADTVDSNSDNDSSTAEVPVTQSADLTIAKTVEHDSIAPGESNKWTLNVENKGPSVARDAVVTDILPDNMTITEVAEGCSVEGQAVTCAVGTMQAAQKHSYWVKAILDSAHQGTQPIKNSAQISSNTPDPNPQNSKSSASFTPKQATSDLQIKKTVTTPDQNLEVGRSISYQLEVSNAGPSDARDVVVTDNLPQGLTAVKASSPTGKCKVEGSKVTCSFAKPLPVGPKRLITIDAKIKSSFTGELTNRAAVTSSSTDPNQDNNNAQVTKTPQAKADLRVVKTSSEAVAGKQLVYTVSAFNDGPADAHNVKLKDTLPEGVEYQSVSDTESCAYDSAAKVVNCSFDTIANGAKKEITITTLLPASVPDTQDIVNKVSLQSDTPDPDPDNNNAQVNRVSKQQADLALEKTGAEDVRAGETLQWDLKLTNQGPSDAHDVVLTDTLPAGLAAVTTSDTQKCQVNLTNNRIVCNLGSLAAKQKYQVTLKATVTEGYLANSIENSASVTSSTEDPTDSNNQESHTTNVYRLADVQIKKTGPKNVIAGNELEWQLIATNNGPSSARKVMISDTLPAQVSFISAEADNDQVKCAPNQQKNALECELAELSAQSGSNQVTVTIKAKLKSGTVASQVTNQAAVEAETPEDEADQENNQTSFTSQVEKQADLSVSKRLEPAELTRGSQAQYFVTVKNNGPSTAREVVVKDTLPAGLTAVAPESEEQYQVSGQTVTFPTIELPAGESRVYALPVKVAADAPDTVQNQVSADSSTPDSNKDNNSFQLTSNVKSKADLQVSKLAKKKSVNAGAGLTYKLQVVNKGPSPALKVNLSDRIPANTSFVSASDGCTYNPDEKQVVCEIAELRKGASKGFEVTVEVDPAAKKDSKIKNTAKVTAETPEVNPDDNTSSVETPVTTSADLQIEKSAVGTSVVPGKKANWVIKVNNAGNSDAQNVSIKDMLPAGLTFADPLPESCTTDPAKQVLTCTLASLPAGQEAQLEVAVSVPSDYQAEAIQNSASVTSDTTDPNPGNNTATASNKVLPQADLAVTKTSESKQVTAGTEVTFKLDAENKGPSVARQVEFSDTLAPGMTLVAASGQDDAGNPLNCESIEIPALDQDNPALTQVKCTLDSLAVGHGAQVSIKVKVSPTFTGDLTNRADVGSETGDPNSKNNESEVKVPTNSDVDLSVKITGSEKVKTDSPISWTVDFGNQGKSTATGVELRIELPQGISDVQVQNEKGTCRVQGNTLICTFDQLEPAEKGQIKITAKTAKDASGSLQISSEIKSKQVDSKPQNNRDQAKTEVIPPSQPTPPGEVTPSPGGEPEPGNGTQPGDEPAPGNGSQPGDKPAPGNSNKPGSDPAPGNGSQPGDKPAPGNSNKPGSDPAPGNGSQPAKLSTALAQTGSLTLLFTGLSGTFLLLGGLLLRRSREQ